MDETPGQVIRSLLNKLGVQVPTKAVQAIQLFPRGGTQAHGEALAPGAAALGVRSCCAHLTVGLAITEK